MSTPAKTRTAHKTLGIVTGVLVGVAGLLGVLFAVTGGSDDTPVLPASVQAACHTNETVGDTGVLYPVKYPEEYAHCVAVMSK